MLSFEDRQTMHEENSKLDPRVKVEIGRGSVVLRGDTICLVQRVADGVVYAVTEDGQEVAYRKEEVTAIAEEELLKVLKARIRERGITDENFLEDPETGKDESSCSEEELVPAPDEQIAEATENPTNSEDENMTETTEAADKPEAQQPESQEDATPAKEEKPMPPLIDGWYQLEQYDLEIAPGLKLTGLQICKAKYESNLKAFANIKLNGVLAIYGFRILHNGREVRLFPPQREGRQSPLDIVTLEDDAFKRLKKIILKLAKRTGII